VAGGRVFWVACAEDENEDDVYSFFVTDGMPGGYHRLLDFPLIFEEIPLPHLAAAGDRAFLFRDDPVAGTEVWTSDGTIEGTRKLLQSAVGRRQPATVTSYGGRIFFLWDDGIHGIEPWTSDGTPAGTFLLAEVRPGECGALGPRGGWMDPMLLIHGGETLFFSADDGIHGFELWGLGIESAPRFLRGEANGDGTVDLSDAISVLSFLFLGGEAPACLDAADVDDDGQVDLTDPIAILGHLFLGNGPLPAPSADYGTDPSPDELGCAEHKACE